MTVHKMDIAIVTDGDGAADIDSPHEVNGRILALLFTLGTLSSGAADVTVKLGTTLQTLWAKTNANANATVRPRAQIHGSDGVALVLNDSDDPYVDHYPAASEPINIVVAQGGASKTGSLTVLWDEGRDVKIHRTDIAIVCDGNGDADVDSPKSIRGKILALIATKGTLADEFNIDVTLATTGVVLWDEDDLTASKTIHPRAPIHDNAGTALVLNSDDDPYVDYYHAADELLNVVVSDGGDGGAGTLTVLWEDDSR